jgi:hypothetical protein
MMGIASLPSYAPMQDADVIMADCEDMMAKDDLDRDATIQSMLDEQPVALGGGDAAR